MPTIKELKQHISGLSEDEPVHYVLWFKEAVLELREGVTEEVAIDVLEALQHNHDCNQGTTWDAIHSALDEYMEPTLEDKIWFHMQELKRKVDVIYDSAAEDAEDHTGDLGYWADNELKFMAILLKFNVLWWELTEGINYSYLKARWSR